MKTITYIKTLKETLRAHKKDGKRIGFVPTMGYLHTGHLGLVEKSKAENDITVVSIFVNPTQFGPTEDLDRYPRDLQRDEAQLRNLGVDFVFYPTPESMYPNGYRTYVRVEKMSDVLCGKSRPTHFRGVTTVVLKLFNIVTPTHAYFGRKDAQQAIILKRMAIDLDLDVVIKTIPIVRDTDGLALSSRNIYLSPQEREAALNLPRALQQARKNILDGQRDPSRIKEEIEKEITTNPLVSVDYVEIATLDTLEPYISQQKDNEPEDSKISEKKINNKPIDIDNTLVAAAVKVGKTRLIDNFILGEV